MRVRFCLAMAMALGMAGSSALAAERAIQQQIVRLTAEDGVKIDVVMMTPAAGMNVASPVIVMHHGGPGGHAARSIGAYRFAAERLAEAGYTTLSPVSRHSSGYYKYVLADAVKDMKATVDFAAAFGFDKVVLAGHSMGSVSVTLYQVAHQNPLVKAMIHFAPTADTFPFVGSRPSNLPIVEAAEKEVAAGRGDLNLFRDSVDPDASLAPPSMMATERGRLQTPQALISWWGRGYPNANSDLFPKLTVPQLLMAGTNDPPVPRGRMEELKRLAVKSPRVDIIWYEGGDHYFTFHQEESSRDTLAWLKDIGLGPASRVTTKLVDTPLNASFTEGGGRVPYPGIAYLREGIDRSSSPLIVYLYSRSGQIFEDPLHRLGSLMAARGYEGIAPQLRESGFRGGLTSTIARSAEDIADVLKLHRSGDRPLIFVGHREGVLWALETVKQHKVSNVLGFVALSPPPNLADYAAQALGKERYDSTLSRARQMIEAKDQKSFLVEKYFRPTPAAPGSTDALMLYPETFIDYFGDNPAADFAAAASSAGAPVLFLRGGKDSMLRQTDIMVLNRLDRRDSVAGREFPNADENFTGQEDGAADAIAAWIEAQTGRARVEAR